MKYDMETGEISNVTEDAKEDASWTTNLIQSFIRFLTALFKLFASLVSKSA